MKASTQSMTHSHCLAALLLFLAVSVPATARETLHNGIELPDEWPPKSDRVTREPGRVPYLAEPPAVIPIDVGRQLFVDDFLIATTNLHRTFHQPEYHSANPVLTPGEAGGEKKYEQYATPFSGGVCYDPADKLFKMWYTAVKPHSTRFATSVDGIHWQKPELDVRPGTNLVLKPRSFNSTAIWLDLQATNPAERFKYFASEDHHRLDGEPAWHYSYRTSADGIHWSDPKARAQVWGDRTTAFYDPFRDVWVCSQRTEDADGKRARS